MSEFKIEEALSGVKVNTLDDREVLIAGFNEGAEDFEKILGWIKDEEGWYSQSWYIDGSTISEKESMDDLKLVK